MFPATFRPPGQGCFALAVASLRSVCARAAGPGCADAELLGAAEGDVGAEGELLAVTEAQPGVAAGQFFHREPGFQFADEILNSLPPTSPSSEQATPRKRAGLTN